MIAEECKIDMIFFGMLFFVFVDFSVSVRLYIYISAVLKYIFEKG